jgi:hypothetical protein
MFHDPEFESGLGLDVHSFYQIRRDFRSFAALRIGKDVLEVASQGSILVERCVER